MKKNRLFKSVRGYALIVVACLSVCIRVAPVDASPIARTWVHSTVLIQNEHGEKGTGFLIFRPSDKDPNEGRVFLVTNKHVIGKTEEQRKAAKTLILALNGRPKIGVITPGTAAILLTENGVKFWQGHPDPNVDVAVVDVTALLVRNPALACKDPDYSAFPSYAELAKHDITIGSSVLMVGYPLGIAHAHSNYPLVRQGIIASNIEENISDPETKHELPAFYIDSMAVPGSSGSPVVVNPGLISIDISTSPPTYKTNGESPWLLGILASGPIGKVMNGKNDFNFLPGLGIVYRWETIRETIEQFFPAFSDPRLPNLNIKRL